MIFERLSLMSELLASDGSIYVHCDWRVTAFMRLALDELFGSQNFINEIIWKRSEAHSDSGSYGKIHDSILFYGKTSKPVWNKQHVAYSAEYVEKQFKYTEPTTKRRYSSADLSTSGLSGGGYTYEWNGITRSWRCPISPMQRHEQEKRLDYTGKGLEPVIKLAIVFQLLCV
jgi:adenine-specific DNA-methyltransferase